MFYLIIGFLFSTDGQEISAICNMTRKCLESQFTMRKLEFKLRSAQSSSKTEVAGLVTELVETATFFNGYCNTNMRAIYDFLEKPFCGEQQVHKYCGEGFPEEMIEKIKKTRVYNEQK